MARMNGPESLVVIHQEIGTQPTFIKVIPEELPTFLARDVDERIFDWATVRSVNVDMEPEEVEHYLKHLSIYWGDRTETLYSFRGGSMGMAQTARIIGCRPGAYLDENQDVVGRFLRIYIQCDPELLGTDYQPPELV